eukprot:GDKI01021838.1.p1 GENE.GDKI01021838.1~~GDKI01021838.1.p1  ORF type:complete len:441 (-),score=152.45 GDKI01021838.1:43-1365(-)
MDFNFSTPFYVFVGLCCVAAAGQLKNWSNGSSESQKDPRFKSFQRTYLVVYLIMMTADWLQGPYMYSLYKNYGFSMAEIGQLFVVGFGSTALFGVVCGTLADKLGRKMMAVMFGVIYSTACVLYHYGDFQTLLLGRLLAGIATSLLFTVFDSWMVAEHNKRGFEGSLLGSTFSTATFGNGLVAILAGLMASVAKEKLGFTGPFDLSACFLILGAVVILLTWTENYGSSSGGNVCSDFTDAVKTFFCKSEVWMCGMVQSFFEGSMYTFVFMWTPALPEDTNHGLIFAIYMVCVMIGSLMFGEFMRRGFHLARVLVILTTVSACALYVPAMTQDPTYRLAAFCVFETMVGMYFPSYYTLRSQIVPDKGRATILNFYQIPLNIIVVIVCQNTSTWSIQTCFAICTGLQLLAGILAFAILMKLQKKEKVADNDAYVPLDADQKA